MGAVAGLVGAGVSGVGSILGGLFGGKSAGRAAKVLQQAGQQASQGVQQATTAGQKDISNAVPAANSILQNEYTALSGNLSPYLQAGATGANNLLSAVAPGGALSQQFAFDPSAIYRDPSYQFNLQQGTQAIQRSAASQGGLYSGGTQKSLAQYASGLASNEYQNAFNRSLTTFQTNRQNTLQNLTALLGTGQFGTQQLNQVGTSLTLPQASNTFQGGLANAQLGLQGAEAAGQFALQGAGAGAAGIVGQSNAYGSILPGVANAFQGYGLYNAYQNYLSPSVNWPSGSTSFNTGSGQYTYGGAGSNPNPYGDNLGGGG